MIFKKLSTILMKLNSKFCLIDLEIKFLNLSMEYQRKFKKTIYCLLFQLSNVIAVKRCSIQKRKLIFKNTNSVIMFLR